MAEKTQPTASVSNGTKIPRPPLKQQDTDKDFYDYFVCAQFKRRFYLSRILNDDYEGD